MQRAEESSPRLVPEPAPPRSGLSPQVAFLGLILVIALLGATVFLTRPEAPAAPTEPTTAQQPDFSLTNAEAITRFNELQASYLRMYSQADATLIDAIFTPTSRIKDRVRIEVRDLVRDGVVADFDYNNSELEVLANSPTEIRIQQTALVRSAFFDKSGRDVTTGGEDQVQTIVWTLHLVNSDWLVHDALIVEAEPSND